MNKPLKERTKFNAEPCNEMGVVVPRIGFVYFGDFKEYKK